MKLKKDDLIAVYIPEQRKGNAPYPLQVLISGNQTKPYPKLVRGSGEYWKVVSKEKLTKTIQNAVKRVGRGKWMQEVDDVKGELNVEVKIIILSCTYVPALRTSQHVCGCQLL